MNKAMTPEEIQFIQKLIADSKTREAYWKVWNNPKTIKKILKLMAKYGRNKVNKTIDILKKRAVK